VPARKAIKWLTLERVGTTIAVADRRHEADHPTGVLYNLRPTRALRLQTARAHALPGVGSGWVPAG